MKKVICFARVSTLQQSLDAQVESVKKAIISDGYNEDEIIYVQGKESAIKLDEEQRQTLNEVKELVRDNPSIEAIYYFAVDRLARRMSIIMNVVEWAIENKINLVFLNPHRMSTFRIDEYGNKVEDEITKLLLAMLSYGAEMEMKVKKARFATAKQAMKLQGKLPQGKPIKGYYLDEDRTILINENEASLIRNLFNDYLNGDNESMNSLHKKYVVKGLFEPLQSKYLNAGKTKVWNLFKDPSYCGRTKIIKKVVKGVAFNTEITYPAIISEEMWEAVQAKLASRKQQPKKNTKNIYYGKGLIKCGECGASMKTDTYNCTYTCKEKKGHTLSVNMNCVDNLTWLTAKGWYNWYTMIDWSSSKEQYQEQINDIKAKITISENQLQEQYQVIDDTNIRLLSPKSRLKQEVADKIINEADEEITKLTKHISQLKQSLDNYNSLLSELENQKVVAPREFDKFNDVDRVEVIKKVVEKIEVIRHKDNKYMYDIHYIPTERIKPFANIDKMYWQYDSKHQKLYLVEFYEDAFVNGKCVKNEWITKDMSWHLEEKRHPQRQRTKKGNA